MIKKISFFCLALFAFFPFHSFALGTININPYIPVQVSGHFVSVFNPYTSACGNATSFFKIYPYSTTTNLILTASPLFTATGSYPALILDLDSYSTSSPVMLSLFCYDGTNSTYSNVFYSPSQHYINGFSYGETMTSFLLQDMNL